MDKNKRERERTELDKYLVVKAKEDRELHEAADKLIETVIRISNNYNEVLESKMERVLFYNTSARKPIGLQTVG
ncbi:hypothetical protein bpr_II366 (plasmid) [Butyrivibrio proteoclasticus B316]|uniref:Uncharacterized protein n=1 Tax=Butyrivibrio proteoclasticus (strain ATCC 51982 / DSM 14932 / B316) TaxID=515622 RepID=E0S4H1_BUTPB|nr:hypothetical protein [Butyrivibrio proteoclasticus]ADL36303.1 hypothetical protein bpr_II366 [Butyrivibrio proteoclasticus B316]